MIENTGTLTSLAAGIIHILHFRLNTPWDGERPMEALLTETERARISRLGLPLLRQRAALSRAWLRTVLGEVRGESPQRVPIEITTHGKPLCVGGPAFNISHSEDRLVIALATEGEIGVDIEMIRPLEELDELAALVFSPAERQQLGALPPAARLAAFYRGWTRKEALIKAVGKGLSMPLERFSVDLGESRHNALLESHIPGLDTERWQVLPVACDPEATLAVASSIPMSGVNLIHEAEAIQLTRT